MLISRSLMMLFLSVLVSLAIVGTVSAAVVDIVGSALLMSSTTAIVNISGGFTANHDTPDLGFYYQFCAGNGLCNFNIYVPVFGPQIPSYGSGSYNGLTANIIYGEGLSALGNAFIPLLNEPDGTNFQVTFPVTVTGSILAANSLGCCPLVSVPVFDASLTGTGNFTAIGHTINNGVLFTDGSLSFSGTADVHTPIPEPSSCLLLGGVLPLLWRPSMRVHKINDVGNV